MPQRDNTQYLAWGVLLISFAVFCVIVIFVIIGIQYFLFQSRVPMQSVVRVARGTATMIGTDLIEQAVKGEREIFSSAILTTDPQSQATISFTDQQEHKLIATITLKGGSSLDLKQNSRPRFNWSEYPYWLDLEDTYGEFDVFVVAGLEREILLTFETTLGPSVRLTASGRYTIVAAGSQVQVVNYVGDALLITPDMRSQSVPAGQQAAVLSDTAQFTLLPTLTNLLGNSTFSGDNVIDYNAPDNQARPAVWRCNSIQNDSIAGSFGALVEDGRPVLRLFRDGGTQAHGETRCVQGFGNGLDVSTFNYLSLQVTFNIQNQSLAACGIDFSECPLTLQMDYYPPPQSDQPPKATTWYHGFYTVPDPTVDFRQVKCDSCFEPHELINSGAWYTYESGNILEVFPIETRPESILNLRLYASGHEYEVYVSEFALLADQTPIDLTAGS
jgi:hypothetical protein